MKLPVCSDECVPKYWEKMNDGPKGWLQPNGQPFSQEIWDRCCDAFTAYHNAQGKCVGCGKRTNRHREVVTLA